jgi:hypothetical protein
MSLMTMIDLPPKGTTTSTWNNPMTRMYVTMYRPVMLLWRHSESAFFFATTKKDLLGDGTECYLSKQLLGQP